MNDSNISNSFNPLILLMKKGLLPRFFLDRKKKTCIHAYFSFLEIENTSTAEIQAIADDGGYTFEQAQQIVTGEGVTFEGGSSNNSSQNTDKTNKLRKLYESYDAEIIIPYHISTQ